MAQQQQETPDNASAAYSTETLTMLDASGSTLVATMTLVNDQPTQNGQAQTTPSSSQPTTLQTTHSPTEPAIITSIIEPTATDSGPVATVSHSSNLDENGIDVEAGASGSSSSGFNMSTGGMIAVIVVVVGVALFGGESPPITQYFNMG